MIKEWLRAAGEDVTYEFVQVSQLCSSLPIIKVYSVVQVLKEKGNHVGSMFAVINQ